MRTGLTIVYSSKPTETDALKAIAAAPAISKCLIGDDGIGIPIYGELARFRGQGLPLLHNNNDSEIVAMEFSASHTEIVRVGYDLFKEVAFLLSDGQPEEYALIPTLEYHISLLRGWIVDAGFPVVEIPPIPWGHSFIVCLAHDIDFVGIRRYKIDYTFWGFVYRALAGSLFELARNRSSWDHVVKNWVAVLSLSLVYLKVREDFWDQFETYAEIEKGLVSTFFLVPFKDLVGNKMGGRFSSRRATRYDINDVKPQVKSLVHRGLISACVV